MRQIFIIICLVSINLMPTILFGQDAIFTQGFESDNSDEWSFIKEMDYGDIQNTTEKTYSGAFSLMFSGSYKKNDDPFIEFAALNFESPLNYALISLAWAAKGPDNLDKLYLDYRLSEDVSWLNAENIIIQKGYNNIQLEFGEMPLSSQTSFTSNPGKLLLSEPFSFFQMRIRFDEKSSTSNLSDYYYIDDIQFQGFLNPPSPVNCQLSPISDSEIQLSASLNDFEHDMLILEADSDNWENLVDGIEFPRIGQNFGGGKVFYYGNADDIPNCDALLPGQRKYFRFVSYNQDFTYSNPIDLDGRSFLSNPQCSISDFRSDVSATQVRVDWYGGIGDSVAEGFVLQLSLDETFMPLVDFSTEEDQLNVSVGTDALFNLLSPPNLFYWYGLEPSTSYNLRITPFNNYGNQIRYGSPFEIALETSSLMENSLANPFDISTLLESDLGSYFVEGFLFLNTEDQLYLCQSPVLKFSGPSLRVQASQFPEYLDLIQYPNNQGRRILFIAELEEGDSDLYLNVVSDCRWLEQLTFFMEQGDYSWDNQGNWFPCLPKFNTIVQIDAIAADFILDIPANIDVNKIYVRGSYEVRPSLSFQDIPENDIILKYQICCKGFADNPVNWAYLGSPIGDMLIENSCIDPSEDMDLYKWDEQENFWINYKHESLPFESIAIGEGILFASSCQSPLCFQGEVFFDVKEYQNLSLTLEQGNGWHFISNPYPKSIQWNPEFFEIQGFNSHVYLWDSDAGNYTVFSEGYSIPVASGFFVKAEEESNSLVLSPFDENTDRIISTDEMQILFSIKNTENSYSDKVAFSFGPDGSLKYNPKYDAPKLFGYDQAPQLFFIDCTEKYLSKKLFLNQDIEFSTHLKCPKGNYEISCELRGIETKALQILVREDGSEWDLSENAVFPIAVDENETIELLKVKYTASAGIADHSIVKEKVLSWKRGKPYWILSSSDFNKHQGKLLITDLLGRTIYTSEIEFCQEYLFTPNVLPGIYMLSFIENDQKATALLFNL